MAAPRFYNEFIMISWAGLPATGNPAGDPGAPLVARIRDKEKAVQLLPNPFIEGGKPWSRSALTAWLLQAVLEDRPIMVGFDFPFGLPWVDKKLHFPGYPQDPEDMQALWRVVATVAADEPDLLAQAAEGAQGFGDWFRGRSGQDGAKFEARLRVVDGVAPQDIRPESCFNLGDPRFGGELSGMRALRLLKTAVGRNLAIWPMEKPKRAQPTFVEILPALFWRQASVGKSEVGTVEGLNRGLRAFQAELGPMGGLKVTDRRLCDTLIGAVALRHLVRNTEAWMPRKLNEAVAKHEGWIFGIY